jgi:hypothetical protein
VNIIDAYSKAVTITEVDFDKRRFPYDILSGTSMLPALSAFSKRSTLNRVLKNDLYFLSCVWVLQFVCEKHIERNWLQLHVNPKPCIHQAFCPFVFYLLLFALIVVSTHYVLLTLVMSGGCNFVE